MKRILRSIVMENEKPQSDSIFLGGTCNDDKWREELIPHLSLPYFNPVIENWRDRDWTEQDQEREIHEKEKATIHLYVITPNQIGWFSFVEMAVSVFRKKKVFIYFLRKHYADFTDRQLTSFTAIEKEFSTMDNVVVKMVDHVEEIRFN